MATIQELIDVVLRINEHREGKNNAWADYLEPADRDRVVAFINRAKEDKSLLNKPYFVPDTLVGALRVRNPDIFPEVKTDATTPAPGVVPKPGQSAMASAEGQEAMRQAQRALDTAHTDLADADQALVRAILDAHYVHGETQGKLQILQSKIEHMVMDKKNLDTPLGASEFANQLLKIQGEIYAALNEADVDANTRTAAMADLFALTPLAAAAGKPDATGKTDTTGATPGHNDSATPAGPSGGDVPVAGGGGGGAGDPSGMMSGLSPSDLGLGGGGSPLGGLGSAMPQIPGLGGGGMPGLGSGGGGLTSGLGDLLKQPKDKPHEADSVKSLLDGPGGSDHDGEHKDKPASLLDEHKDEHKPDGEAKPNNEHPVPGAPVPGQLAPQTPAGTGPTEVRLANGQSVTAPNPQLAGVTKAVAEGTPIADAFRQNAGVTIPPPGAAVHNPMDPSRITMGAVGQFTDHQVYAISKDLVYMNGQIRPIAEASGPGFLGWMPPPDIATAPVLPQPSATPVAAAAPGASSPVPAVPAAAATTLQHQ